MKEKRQARMQRTQRAVDRQVTIYRIAEDGKYPKTPGKYRKGRARGCGRPRCKICGNPRHNWGYLTVAEERNLESFKQQLQELY